MKFLVKIELKSCDWFEAGNPGSLAGVSFVSLIRRLPLVTAVNHAPPGPPGRGYHSAHVAAAIAVIAGTGGIEVRAAAPAVMPTTMPTTMPTAMPTAVGPNPCRSRSRRQRSHAQRSRSECNKREFAQHGHLHKVRRVRRRRSAIPALMSSLRGIRSRAGYPCEAEPGRHGGVRLRSPR